MAFRLTTTHSYQYRRGMSHSRATRTHATTRNDKHTSIEMVMDRNRSVHILMLVIISNVMSCQSDRVSCVIWYVMLDAVLLHRSSWSALMCHVHTLSLSFLRSLTDACVIGLICHAPHLT